MPIANSFYWTEKNEEVYDDLIVAVEASDQVLSLLLAVCDDPHFRDEIIERYEAELQPRIHPYRVQLSRKEPSLREAIAQALNEDELYLQSEGRAVITVTGTDALLADRLGAERSEKDIFFGYLQWTREALREYPYPIILWLTNPLLKELSLRAPDFWSWRKDVLRFQSAIILEATIRTSYRIIASLVLVPHNLPRMGAGQFVGRDREMEWLHEQFQSGELMGITVLTGMGGIGKTELALQYAHGFYLKGAYPGGVCWLNARGVDVGMQFLGFASSKLGLNPPEYWHLEERIRYCWRHWKPEGEVLVIFDDVQDYETIRPVLPPAKEQFKVLITTRNQSLGQLFRQLELAGLEEEAALQLLGSLVGRERIYQELEAAKALCVEVGYLPLALELLARHLAHKQDLSLANMQQQLQKEGLEVQALKRAEVGMTAERWVKAAFELSWRELGEEEKELGRLLSLFALAPITWSWVETIYSEVDEKKLEDSRESLERLSLLQPVEEGSYQLHPLIREFFRGKLVESSQVEEMKREICRVMVEVARTIPETLTHQQIMEVEPAIPHLVEIAEQLTDDLTDDELPWVFVGLARFYLGQEQYGQAGYWFEQCLDIIEYRLGSADPNVATSLNNLAELYRSQGKYSEAEPLYLKALQMRKELLGSVHPSVAMSLNNLAALYEFQGRYSEAEPLLMDALQIWQETFGSDHSNVAATKSNLANLYRYQGKYEQAEPLYLDALQMHKNLFGSAHPYIAISLNNLGNLYLDQKRLSKAEALYLEALQMYNEMLGSNHLYSAMSKSNLANLYLNQGRNSEAESLYLEALQISREKLGSAHPFVAVILNNLANLYYSQGKYADAQLMYMEALEIFMAKLGEDHPNTRKLKQNYNERYQGGITMSGERTIGIGRDDWETNINTPEITVVGDAAKQGEQININYGQDKELVEATREIQDLLKQLSASHPVSTTMEQMTVVTEVIKVIESNPTLKQRTINAFKVGLMETLKQFPGGAILVGAIEGWIQQNELDNVG
ncbi:tetratricopeptide repeat protein [Roseofilum sp. Guam]|uniref:tetratricopeptide repeat protein n=1 Tax=Roseofilum sp. Guam TaxID=2821502 RepID=UPI001B119C6D|nr:tetratricopeptide repeat protein [Roseofilum sp. Guam]MBP0029998.1 tetratricopeptide repeat protein [Roseofilum sp. Guam]